MAKKKNFEEAHLGELKLKNRLIRSATWEGLADAGHMPEEMYRIYGELADGGVGAIITGFTSVSDNDHYFSGMARLSNDDLIPEHKRLTDIAHRENIPIIAQLALGEYRRGMERCPIDKMDARDIAIVIALFTQAAKRAEEAGYDGVQIHAAHSFFLSRFISPLFNHRSDSYGGSNENRARIVLDILRQIKKNCPRLHVTMKINCDDFMPGGLAPLDSLSICELVAENGMDSIEVSGNGTSVPGIRPGVDEAYFKDFALALSGRIQIPIILVGGHRSPENMEKVLNQGDIEFLSLSRPLIREPSLPLRWQEGDKSPSKCISCNACYETPGHQCLFRLQRQ